MHRHGYKGRKFHRERDQRTALIKGLADSLILHQTIETTLPKAKELVPYVERLITKAKKGDLHNRRIIISSLQTLASAHKLVDEIAPKLKKRNSGHLRVVRTRNRKGDNAQLARISFVDNLNETRVDAPIGKGEQPATSKKVTKKKVTVTKTTKKEPKV